ncbi:MAG: hydrogenase maturation nickel metallochaperone HypA [Actinomycetota bacterium]|nr:hydrogenase maturation nickel metallochaperone HypA [Actinomycetota bacterium]MDQ2955713.1 hydrogenase maturation nickel metallochaperone HypA [Actinomycetota bacterium]
MHELAVTQSIVDAVSEYAGDATVSCVRLRVGKLSGVVPHALQFCFELVTEGTTLQGAELIIDEQPGVGHCRGCDSEIALTDLILLCPCGSADVGVTSGRELTIQSIEVAERV